MMGKIVPPTLDPPAKHARASPSLLRNQCVTTPAPRVNMTPLASCPAVNYINHSARDEHRPEGGQLILLTPMPKP